MVKKIFRLFKKKSKSKKKIKEEKKAEVINFINKSKQSNKIQTEKMETKKMDNLAKEIVDNYFKTSTKSFLDIGYCSYIILYRVLQRMLFELSYPVYRHYLNL